MALLRPGTVGILPVGALGVAFYHYLTQKAPDGRVYFVEREGSMSGRAFRERGRLTLQLEDARVKVRTRCRPTLLECAAEGDLPEVLLVCTQPDKLLEVLSSTVRLLEYLHAHHPAEELSANLPTLVLCSNGIYFQRVRQFLLERLEESTLFGRLPDLWPETMPRIVGKLLRGVTIQTGQREGVGIEAAYRPGSSGRTRLAGGSADVRQRCAELLTELGGWFEVAGQMSPTRVEFDKALVNLSVNLLGQLCAIDERGEFRLLTIGEILESTGRDQMRELARRVVEVGQAVHAYRADESFEALWEEMLGSCREHAEHVPSSLQWIQQELRRGTLKPQLTPTEAWLLEPLIRYARAAELQSAAEYFENLASELEGRFACAAATAAKKKGDTGSVPPL